MATKADMTITAHPDWTNAQKTFFFKLKEALPIVMGYLADEMPVLDNTADYKIVDEVGVLKQIKKPVEAAEKTHVERLKARMGDKDNLRGSTYIAEFRGSKRVILNQEKCKELVAEFDEAEIHIGRLLAAIKSGQIQVPENVVLGEIRTEVVPDDGGEPYTVVIPETNHTDYFTTSAGGRALYVKDIV